MQHIARNIGLRCFSKISGRADIRDVFAWCVCLYLAIVPLTLKVFHVHCHLCLHVCMEIWVWIAATVQARCRNGDLSLNP